MQKNAVIFHRLGDSMPYMKLQLHEVLLHTGLRMSWAGENLSIYQWAIKKKAGQGLETNSLSEVSSQPCPISSTSGCILMDGGMDGRADGRADGRMNPLPSLNRHSMTPQPPSIHPADLL